MTGWVACPTRMDQDRNAATRHRGRRADLQRRHSKVDAHAPPAGCVGASVHKLRQQRGTEAAPTLKKHAPRGARGVLAGTLCAHCV